MLIKTGYVYNNIDGQAWTILSGCLATSSTTAGATTQFQIDSTTNSNDITIF